MNVTFHGLQNEWSHDIVISKFENCYKKTQKCDYFCGFFTKRQTLRQVGHVTTHVEAREKLHPFTSNVLALIAPTSRKM